MISRRLTTAQKAEILEAYRAGYNTNDLAEKYHCTANTINRTVKTLLSDVEYDLLKKNRSRINKKTQKEKQADLEQKNSLDKFKGKVKDESQSFGVDERSNTVEFAEIPPLDLFDSNQLSVDLKLQNTQLINYDSDENNKSFDNNFEEIEPLVSSISLDQEKHEKDFKILNFESLPESVYMIVDKKVELDLQTISDMPEWGFLPENELKRTAIVLFSNQRTAKRICSRNQRVIKIPNTNVFNLSKSYLISKGITRLILEDSIIGLDD
mgnify:CR=1 FL=1